MREILFRARRIDNGKWVEGTPYQEYVEFWQEWEWFIQTKHPLTNVPYMHLEIDRKTICQFTGLTDKNGKKIFEGDIIEWFAQGESEHPDFGYIEYDEQSFAWRVCWQKYDPDFMEGMQQEYISVIGNIHDNPELLENP